MSISLRDEPLAAQPRPLVLTVDDRGVPGGRDMSPDRRTRTSVREPPSSSASPSSGQPVRWFGRWPPTVSGGSVAGGSVASGTVSAGSVTAASVVGASASGSGLATESDPTCGPSARTVSATAAPTTPTIDAPSTTRLFDIRGCSLRASRQGHHRDRKAEAGLASYRRDSPPRLDGVLRRHR